MQDGRLSALDGMRGAAALLVVAHHAAPLVLERQFLPRAYLAVDFFFMLSGFVIARAYDRKFAEGLSAATFLTVRLRRLYPVMAIGIIAGAIVWRFNGMAGEQLGLRLMAQLVFLPIIIGEMGLYPLDGVQWSLACELFANLAHGTLLYRCGGRVLIVVMAAALLALGGFAWHFGSAGVGDRGIHILGGVPRVLFSYTLGMLLHRLYAAGRLKGPALPGHQAILLLAVVLVGCGILDPGREVWWADLVVIVVVLPAVLAIGIAATATPDEERWYAIAGRLSYPLYAVHLPVIGGCILLFEERPIVLAIALAASLAAAAAVSMVVDPRAWRYARRRRVGATTAATSAASP